MAFGQEGVRSYRMVSSDKAPMIPYAAATDTVPYARSTLYPAPEATRGGGRPQQGRQMLCIVCCCCLVLVALGLSISALHLVSSPPPFDCKAALGNMDTAWSGLKKEYCCENEGIGCQYVPGYDVAAQQPGQTPPRWLKLWLGDLSTGLKFMISGVAALLLGACCGAAMYARQMRAELAERRAQTEHELLHELQKALKRVGAKDGEIAVTLMWDTKDDLDLHVQLPEPYGEISAENPEVAGGRLDIDGNHCLEMNTGMKPIENIYWPKVDSTSNYHPPIGEYSVYVKAYSKHSNSMEQEANLTAVVSVQGKKDIYHLRLLPGKTEMKVGSFQYSGPSATRP